MKSNQKINFKNSFFKKTSNFYFLFIYKCLEEDWNSKRRKGL